MKRLLMLTVILALLMTAALADAWVEPVEWPGDYLNAPVVLTDEAASFWSIPATQEQIRAAQGEMLGLTMPISFSPTGRSGLAIQDGVLFTFTPDSIHVVYPSVTRGAADEYGNL